MSKKRKIVCTLVQFGLKIVRIRIEIETPQSDDCRQIHVPVILKPKQLYGWNLAAL